MADVFISYAAEDRPKAEVLALALSARGWSVWWDRTLRPGQVWDAVIEKGAGTASCVVVCWSTRSIGSDWVRAEAAEALKRRVLLPVLIEDVLPPLPFRSIHAASFVGWDPDGYSWEFEGFLGAVESLAGKQGRSADEADHKEGGKRESWVPDRAGSQARVGTRFAVTPKAVDRKKRLNHWPRPLLVGLALCGLLGFLWWNWKYAADPFRVTPLPHSTPTPTPKSTPTPKQFNGNRISIDFDSKKKAISLTRFACLRISRQERPRLSERTERAGHWGEDDEQTVGLCVRPHRTDRRL